MPDLDDPPMDRFYGCEPERCQSDEEIAEAFEFGEGREEWKDYGYEE